MKVKNMDELQIILALEGGKLIIEDYDDWCKVIEIAEKMSSSQGFYGRLLNQMKEYERNGISYPVEM